MLKIVHINATDSRGGAAIACSRLNDAMNRAGIDSSMVVANHATGVDRIKQSLYYRINKKKEDKLEPIANFSLMNFGLPIYKNKKVQEANIIFLHWVCANSLSIKGVENILKLGKPTFWFMHDMFPFTGGCHYSLNCDGYNHSCEKCPQISNPHYKNISAKQLANKIRHWQNYHNLEFVSPSTWEAECAKGATLCKSHQIHIAPNILNTDIYKPDKFNFKEKFGLDTNKKTILFGATRINSPYKGASYAHECMSMLDPEKYEGLVIGNADINFIADLPIKVIQTGYLSDDKVIAQAYNACDTFIMTSIAESFGQVVAEAMACGKPCVGFPTGGVLDLIKHRESGYLTSIYDAQELLNGIEWLFEDPNRYQQLSINARKQIVKNNSFQRVLDIHTELHPFLNEGFN